MMEFLLTSTSGEVENRIPNTTIKKYTKRQVRTCSTFEEFDKRFSRREGSAIDNESIPAIEIYNGYRE